jgi:hypothetical protein
VVLAAELQLLGQSSAARVAVGAATCSNVARRRREHGTLVVQCNANIEFRLGGPSLNCNHIALCMPCSYRGALPRAMNVFGGCTVTSPAPQPAEPKH